jgi:hypothetical protein
MGRGLLPPHHVLKRSQNLVQQSLELGEQVGQRSSAIQKVGHITQQVAQKVACTRDRGDVKHDLVQVNHKPKNVEVQRAQHKIDEAATGIGADHGQGHSLSEGRRSSVPSDNAVQYSLSYELVTLNGKMRNADQAGHAIGTTVAPLHVGTEGMRNLGWRGGLRHGASRGHGERTEGQQGEDCGKA